jgi:DNA-binding IclR family transcriptional regulator
MGLGELVAACGLPKPTVRRMLLGLIDQSLALQNDAGKYELGNGPIDLTARCLTTTDLADTSRPVLNTLRQHTAGTIVLCRLADDRRLTNVLEVHAASSSYVVTPDAGAPLYATAAGKAVLAFLPAADLRRLTPQEITPLTPHTLSTRAELEEEAKVIRDRGYALENEEAAVGVRAIAAPIRSFTARPIGAIVVAAPAKLVAIPELARMSSHLTAAADDISAQFGGSPVASSRRRIA